MCRLVNSALVILTGIFSLCDGYIGEACDSTQFCEDSVEHSVCYDNKCECKLGYYLNNDVRNISSKGNCIPCPALGEYCATVQCCRHSSYLVCSDGYCRCRNSYDGIYCWNANSAETVQFESFAEIILGFALLFTIAVLGSLVWRLCQRQHNMSQNSQSMNRDASFASLNSIQRLVFLRLQDRPPPYSQSYRPWKYFSDNRSSPVNNMIPSEPPPPYSISVSSQTPSVSLPQTGIDNTAYLVEELPRPILHTSSTTNIVNLTNDSSSASSTEELSILKVMDCTILAEYSSSDIDTRDNPSQDVKDSSEITVKTLSN